MCIICRVHGEPLNEGAEKVLRKANMEKLTQAQIKAAVERQIWTIVRTLQGGDRVEIIPTKDGVKVLKVERSEIK